MWVSHYTQNLSDRGMVDMWSSELNEVQDVLLSVEQRAIREREPVE